MQFHGKYAEILINAEEIAEGKITQFSKVAIT